MGHRVAFSPEARGDLLDLFDHIAADTGARRAFAYTSRIEQACFGLAEFPHRGAPRGDIRPGLRVLALWRRVRIAYTVSAGEVTIVRILYGGRQLPLDDAE